MGEETSWRAPLVVLADAAEPVADPVPLALVEEAPAKVELTTEEVATREAVAVPSSTSK